MTKPYITEEDSVDFHVWYSQIYQAVHSGDNIPVKEGLKTKSITFVVTEDCNLRCTYCYIKHKQPKRMTKEVGFAAVDFILNKEKLSGYIDSDATPCVILEFIGGEPLLEIDLIDDIVEYFKFKAMEIDHPWAVNYMINITTNGILLDNEKTKAFLDKNKKRVSIAMTIDGTKRLHDACRVYPDGRGSYDDVVRNVNYFRTLTSKPGTKVTLAPDNIGYTAESIFHIWELGIPFIHANVVFEEGWKIEHAKTLYEQMKIIADRSLSEELYKNSFCSLFSETIGSPLSRDEDNNWCFKEGTSILTPNGNMAIENLSAGDSVVSGNGSIQKVEKVIKRLSDDTATIKAAGIFKTYTTADHPYMVKRFKYIGNKNVRRYADPEWVKVKDIKKGDKIALHVHKFGDVEVDKSLAYIVGRYIGDGWHSTTGYKLCCSYEEYGELKQAMDKAGINYSDDDYRTVKQFNIFKNNTELIDILSQIGHNAFTKNIPKCAFTWNKASVESLLKGLLDADGCIDVKQNLEKFNTVSPVLANDILTIVRGLGYFPTCYLSKRAGKSKIEGREVNIRDRYEVYFKLDKSSKSCEYDKDNDVIWTTVRNVQLDCESYEVYNLTVENEHTYIANGSVVHNCGGDGNMLAIGTDGKCYPCIRFMPYSLSVEGREPLEIGDIYSGIESFETCGARQCLSCIKRSTQSTKECMDCKIASGCAWCTGYNYDIYGTPDKRATFICVMHKARVLANAYYFNRLYKKLGIDEHFDLNVDEKDAIDIVGKEEYDMLKGL